MQNHCQNEVHDRMNAIIKIVIQNGIVVAIRSVCWLRSRRTLCDCVWCVCVCFFFIIFFFCVANGIFRLALFSAFISLILNDSKSFNILHNFKMKINDRPIHGWVACQSGKAGRIAKQLHCCKLNMRDLFYVWLNVIFLNKNSKSVGWMDWRTDGWTVGRSGISWLSFTEFQCRSLMKFFVWDIVWCGIGAMRRVGISMLHDGYHVLMCSILDPIRY